MVAETATEMHHRVATDNKEEATVVAKAVTEVAKAATEAAKVDTEVSKDKEDLVPMIELCSLATSASTAKKEMSAMCSAEKE